MIGSNLWDYSDACIRFKRTIIITEVGTDEAARQADETNKQVIFISQTPLTNCINEINYSKKILPKILMS